MMKKAKAAVTDDNGIPISDDFWDISHLGDSSKPRGIRNNNPGNVEMGNSKWQGQIPNSQNSDGRFLQFTKFWYGVRCCTKLIYNYITKHKANTISKIVHRYAPSSENGLSTVSYINFVSRKTGFSPDQLLEPTVENIAPIVSAMCEFENGVGTRYVSIDMVRAVWSKI